MLYSKKTTKVIYFYILILLYKNIDCNLKNKNIFLIGTYIKNSGLYQHNKAFINCLYNEGFNLYKIDVSNYKFAYNLKYNKNSKLRKIRNSIILVTSPLTDYYDPLKNEAIFDIRLMNKESNIILGYIVIEGSSVHPNLISFANSAFDGLIVPEDFIIDVFKKNGLEIPIFKLPLAIDIKNIININKKVNNENNNKDKKFKFGSSLVFYWHVRKNELLLFKAFYKEFKNDNNVELYIHAKEITNQKTFKLMQFWLKKYNINNIKIINKPFNKEEYINFISSLNCYVLLSKGEGFSITPLEAITCKIPCILSNNTAHKKYCTQPFVIPVECPIIEYINNPNAFNFGEPFFNPNIKDVQKAMRLIYENYYQYKSAAEMYGEKFALSFSYNRLKQLYKNAIKPDKIKLSNNNIINEDCLETNSIEFYKKIKNFYKI